MKLGQDSNFLAGKSSSRTASASQDRLLRQNSWVPKDIAGTHKTHLSHKLAEQEPNFVVSLALWPRTCFSHTSEAMTFLCPSG